MFMTRGCWRVCKITLQNPSLPVEKNRENRGNGMESGLGKSSHLELLHLDVGETIEEARENGMEYVFPLHFITKAW